MTTNGDEVPLDDMEEQENRVKQQKAEEIGKQVENVQEVAAAVESHEGEEEREVEEAMELQEQVPEKSEHEGRNKVVIEVDDEGIMQMEHEEKSEELSELKDEAFAQTEREEKNGESVVEMEFRDQGVETLEQEEKKNEEVKKSIDIGLGQAEQKLITDRMEELEEGEIEDEEEEERNSNLMEKDQEDEKSTKEGMNEKTEKLRKETNITETINEETLANKLEVERKTDVQDLPLAIPAVTHEARNTAEQKQVAFKIHRGVEEPEESSDSSSDEPSELQEVGHDASDSEAERSEVPTHKPPNQKKQMMRTHGEITLEDLPPIEKLQITVGDDVKLVEVGEILHNVGVLVVVESKPNLPPLDADTILFIEGKKVLGQIFDTMGQVTRPCYTVRFNHESEIEEQGLKRGMLVFYAPDSPEWTNYVFLTHIMKFRGSDASWEHDNEPPAQFLDYSDDEAERQAKAKARGRSEEDKQESVVQNKTFTKRRKNTPKCHSTGSNDNKVPHLYTTSDNAPSNKNSSVRSVSGDQRPSQNLTCWPPKFGAQRQDVREPCGSSWNGPRRSQTTRPCRQPPAQVQGSLPDMSRPPPSVLTARGPSPRLPTPFQVLPPFAPPPPHMQRVPPPLGPLPQQPGLVPFQVVPPQAPNTIPWMPFQNIPPFDFTTQPPPQRHSFLPSNIPPFQVGQFSYQPPVLPVFGAPVRHVFAEASLAHPPFAPSHFPSPYPPPS